MTERTFVQTSIGGLLDWVLSGVVPRPQWLHRPNQRIRGGLLRPKRSGSASCLAFLAGPLLAPLTHTATAVRRCVFVASPRSPGLNQPNRRRRRHDE